MTEECLSSSERIKLISELLMAFKHLLPKLTKDYEIRKIKSDIRNYEKFLRDIHEV